VDVAGIQYTVCQYRYFLINDMQIPPLSFDLVFMDESGIKTKRGICISLVGTELVSTLYWSSIIWISYLVVNTLKGCHEPLILFIFQEMPLVIPTFWCALYLKKIKIMLSQILHKEKNKFISFVKKRLGVIERCKLNLYFGYDSCCSYWNDLNRKDVLWEA